MPAGFVQGKSCKNTGSKKLDIKVSLHEIQFLPKFLPMATIFDIFFSSLEHNMHGHFISRHHQNELKI